MKEAVLDAPKLLAEVKRLKKLALEAYQTPMNTGKEKCRIIELLSEMIHNEEGEEE